jgi:hypothetical protein
MQAIPPSPLFLKGGGGAEIDVKVDNAFVLVRYASCIHSFSRLLIHLREFSPSFQCEKKFLVIPS